MTKMTSTHDLMLDFAEQLDDMEERMSRIESRIVQLMYALRLDPNGRYDGKIKQEKHSCQPANNTHQS